MNELIKVSQTVIVDAKIQTVNARDLHAFLDVGKDFSSWIKAQIERARLIENKDFIKLTQKGERQILIEYHLTIEASKHIGMMSGTDKGFEVRDYFLDCERRALQPQKALTPAEALLAQVKLMVEQERRVTALESEQAIQADKVARIEAKQQAFEDGSKFFTIIGYVVWRGMLPIAAAEASTLGKKATKLSKERGVMIDRVRDPRYGMVGSYHESILETVFSESAEGM